MAALAALLATVSVIGCTRPAAGAAEPTPTYIAQPTPNPTMAAVVQGQGPQVAYLPPLEIKGSPTPVPAAARPAPPSGNRTTAKPTASQREAPPAREAAPRPTAPAAAPRAAPTTAAPRASGQGAGTAPAGAGVAPAIINPNTVLPGGPARPNATPAR